MTFSSLDAHDFGFGVRPSAEQAYAVVGFKHRSTGRPIFRQRLLPRPRAGQ